MDYPAWIVTLAKGELSEAFKGHLEVRGGSLRFEKNGELVAVVAAGSWTYVERIATP